MLSPICYNQTICCRRESPGCSSLRHPSVSLHYVPYFSLVDGQNQSKQLKITTFFVDGRRKLITNNQHTAYDMLHCPYMNHSHQRPPQDKQLLTTPPTPTSMQLFLPQCRETCADITTRDHLHASVSRLEQSEGERLRRCVQSASVGMPITRAKAEADTEL